MSKPDKISRRVNKLLITISVIFVISMTLIIAATPGTQGYEDNVYCYYPVILWILAGCLFILPFTYLYISNSKKWRIKFNLRVSYILLIIALTAYVLILYIPLHRGYVLYAAGDTLTHLGYVNEILDNGNIYPTYYPYSHVLVATISLISGVVTTQITFHVVPLFLTLFVLGIFCLTNVLKCTPEQKVAITATSIIPSLGIWLTQESVMPSTISWSLLPLFFFTTLQIISQKEQSYRYILSSLLLFVTISVAHPEGIVYSIFIFLVTIIVGFIHRVIRRELSGREIVKMISIPVIMLVISTIFFSRFPTLVNLVTNTIQNIFEIISGFIALILGKGSGEMLIDSVRLLIGEYSPFRIIYAYGDIADCLSILIGRYGQILLIGFLSIVYIIYFVKNRNYDDRQKLIKTIIIILFLLLSILGVILLVTGCSIAQNVNRQWKYPLIFAIFLLGFYISDVMAQKKNRKHNKFLSLLFTITLIGIIAISINNIYSTQDNAGVSWQVTEQDVIGMKLFYETSSSNIYAVETGTRQHQERYFHMIYGIDNVHQNIRSTFNKNILVQKSLGYEDSMYFGETYPESTYFIKNQPVGLLMHLFQKDGYYFYDITPKDYEHLDFDSSTNLIQNMGDDFSIYISL